MPTNLVAEADVTIDASAGDVWNALVSPAAIKAYMFGTTVTSDWTEGRPITWAGEMKGTRYEDRGVIVQSKPERLLQYTHFSPLAGLPDVPESHHTVTIELSPEGGRTHVVLTQDKNTTEREKEHSKANWQQVLDGLKRFVEAR
jgi:uncharacterized protein YndB with AHSA1/START domain